MGADMWMESRQVAGHEVDGLRRLIGLTCAALNGNVDPLTVVAILSRAEHPSGPSDLRSLDEKCNAMVEARADV